MNRNEDAGGANDLERGLRELRKTLTEAQARLSDLLELAARLGPPPPRVICPSCGVSLRGPRTLEEHVYQLHDGPTPDHWREPEPAPEAEAAS